MYYFLNLIMEESTNNSNNNSNLVIAILAIIFLALVGFLAFMLISSAGESEEDRNDSTQTTNTNTDSGDIDSNNNDGTDNIEDDTSGNESTTQTINITGMSFPAEITVKPGTTVIWNNQDIDHTVTFSDIDVESGVFSRGETFEHTFTEVGEFDYRCEIHPTMRGTIIVEN